MQPPEFWHHDNEPLARLLAPLGWAYAGAGALNRLAVTPWRAPVPVVCIGNVVAGGAGKTPIALSVAEHLKARGLAVHFLSRGYGGSEPGPLRVEGHSAAQVGDEPLLLSRVAPTWIARQRAAGAQAACEAGAQVIVMDDGFQNPSVAKDVSILVLDGGYGVGNGQVMPAGPLREPLMGAVRRATAVVVLGDDTANIAARLDGTAPLSARLVPGPEGEALRGRSVAAFAGIGRPAKFFDTLKALGCTLAAKRAFPDHHPYRSDDLAGLLARAEAEDLPLVTTAKDAVRVPASLRDRLTVLTVGVEWGDEGALDQLLAPALHGKP